MLAGSGRISIDVNSGVAVNYLAVNIAPARTGVEVVVDDTGVGDWKAVEGTASAEQWRSFVTRLSELVDATPGDCGTHGFWVERCMIHLPLTSHTIDLEATEGDRFSSEPVVQHVLAFIDHLAQLPGSRSTSWRRHHRRRLLVRLSVSAAAIAALVVALFGLR